MNLFLSLVIGLVGSAYILYGRRQYEPWFIACGFALVAYPYFVTDTLITLLIGTVLVLLPILIR